jgi:hypothetical protein
LFGVLTEFGQLIPATESHEVNSNLSNVAMTDLLTNALVNHGLDIIGLRSKVNQGPIAFVIILDSVFCTIVVSPTL